MKSTKKKKKVRSSESPARRSEVTKISVTANQTGYYDLKLHRPGDKFTYRLKPHETHLPHWVTALDEEHKHLESEDTTKDFIPGIPTEPAEAVTDDDEDDDTDDESDDVI